MLFTRPFSQFLNLFLFYIDMLTSTIHHQTSVNCTVFIFEFYPFLNLHMLSAIVRISHEREKLKLVQDSHIIRQWKNVGRNVSITPPRCKASHCRRLQVEQNLIFQLWFAEDGNVGH
jgi:hypothetical protein